MKTLKMTDDWDLKINSSGKLEFIEGVDKYSQDISTILKTNKGQDPFYENLGVDWFMIINYPTRNNLIDGINDALSQFYKPVVVEDMDIEEDRTKRTYSVDLRLKVGGEFTEVNFNIGE